MNTLTFRRASAKDIELLGLLAREIWTSCYPGIISIEQIEYMLRLMYSKETIGKEINDGVRWEIMEYKGKPIGFIAVTISNNGDAKLNKLYMKESFHGMGFGQQALQHVVDFSRELNLKQVYLTVNKGNVNAMKAYSRFGFKQTDAVVNDIGGGYVMDDYIYTYSL